MANTERIQKLNELIAEKELAILANATANGRGEMPLAAQEASDRAHRAEIDDYKRQIRELGGNSGVPDVANPDKGTSPTITNGLPKLLLGGLGAVIVALLSGGIVTTIINNNREDQFIAQTATVHAAATAAVISQTATANAATAAVINQTATANARQYPCAATVQSLGLNTQIDDVLTTPMPGSAPAADIRSGTAVLVNSKVVVSDRLLTITYYQISDAASGAALGWLDALYLQLSSACPIP
jgi:hypothetical protein